MGGSKKKGGTGRKIRKKEKGSNQGMAFVPTLLPLNHH